MKSKYYIATLAELLPPDCGVLFFDGKNWAVKEQFTKDMELESAQQDHEFFRYMKYSERNFILYKWSKTKFEGVYYAG